MKTRIRNFSLLIGLSLALPTAAQTTTASSFAVTKALSNSKNYLALDLEKDPHNEFYLIKTQINNAVGYFLLDTGAYTTALTHEGAKALKLKLQEEEGSSYGVGGASKNYSAKIDKLVIGEKMALDQKKIRVINIPALSKGEYGKHKPMGILGSDLLDKLNIVVNLQTHKIYYPHKKNLGLKSTAETNGYTATAFQKGQNVPTLPVKVNGTTTHMVFDTGAKTTIIDLSTAKSNKFIILDSSNNVQGVGNSKLSTKAVFLPTLSFGGIDCSDFGTTSIQLKEKVKDVDGIIGADLLFSSGVIFDYASDTIFTKKQKLKGNDIGLASTLPMSKKEAASLVSKSDQIYSGHIVGLAQEGEMAAAGKTYKKLKLTFLIEEPLKGSSKKGEKVECHVVIPDTPNAVANFTSGIHNENKRLLILDKQPINLASKRLFKTSSLRVLQVKKILKP